MRCPLYSYLLDCPSIQGYPFEKLTFSVSPLYYLNMYIVPIAWLYVALMMAVAEANHANGTVMGAVFTFLLYGLGPVALVVYLMDAPRRRRVIKAREAAELARTPSVPPDADRDAAADAVAPVRKEP